MKLTILIFISILICTSALNLSAQVVSVEYGEGITPNQTAGVIPESGTDWNIDNMSQTYFSSETTGLSNLVDNSGNATSIGETKTDFGTYGPNGQTTGFSSGGDNNLFSHGPFIDYNYSTPNLTLTGLNSAATYDLYIFVRNPQPSDSNFIIQASLGTQNFYFTPFGDEATSYVGATGLTPATANQANYVEFTGITGVNSVAANLVNSNNGLTLSGFQLVQTPEPSSFAMLAIGLPILALALRRLSQAEKRS